LGVYGTIAYRDRGVEIVFVRFRAPLPTMKTLEWIKVRKGDDSIKGDSTPHAQLLDLHETLAGAPKVRAEGELHQAKIKNGNCGER
jgi:hypothetical protein